MYYVNLIFILYVFKKYACIFFPDKSYKMNKLKFEKKNKA